jgi:hypothetical protein
MTHPDTPTDRILPPNGSTTDTLRILLIFVEFLQDDIRFSV